MKTLLLLLTTCGMLAVMPARATETALGIQFGTPGNVGLSLRFDRVSIGAAWQLGNDGYLHTTIDYWAIKSPLGSKVDWFLGPGVDLGLRNPFLLAIRIPIGLQWMPSKDWEIFGDVAPSLQVIDASKFYVAGTIGLRYVL